MRKREEPWSSSLLADDGAGDQLLHDLVGSPVDRLDPGVHEGPGMMHSQYLLVFYIWQYYTVSYIYS